MDTQTEDDDLWGPPTPLPARIRMYAAMFRSPQPDKEYLTKNETASILNCSLKSIERLLKRGLPYSKLGRMVRIRKEDLDGYLKESSVSYGRTEVAS